VPQAGGIVQRLYLFVTRFVWRRAVYTSLVAAAYAGVGLAEASALARLEAMHLALRR
jgi:hypothetical protein